MWSQLSSLRIPRNNMSITQSLEWSSCGNATYAAPFNGGYNAQVHTHYYTTTVALMEDALVNEGYTSTGDAGWAFTTQVASTLPFYRL